MGVEKWASCRLPTPVLISIVLSESPDVVKGIAPPESNCDSLPRYDEGSKARGKEKVFQSVESFKEKSCEIRVPVKAVEEESGNVDVSDTRLSASVLENKAKSQLID
jgi:hypothetical protein